MKARELRELALELDDLHLVNHAEALKGLCEIIAAMIDHMYFRQLEKERCDD